MPSLKTTGDGESKDGTVRAPIDTLFHLCLCTICDSDILRGILKNGGTGTITANVNWKKARRLLTEARKREQQVAVIFAPWEETQVLFGWAILDDIDRKDPRKYTVTNLKEFLPRPRRDILKREKTGLPILRDEFEPNRSCRTRTPELLKHLEASLGTNEGSQATQAELPIQTLNTPPQAPDASDAGAGLGAPEDGNDGVPNLNQPLPRMPKESPDDDDLKAAYAELEEAGYFDPPNNEIAGKRVMRAIAQRQGQSDFRKQLITAYQEKCVVTDCGVVEVLEAAHIKPFCEEQTYLVPNGLLLRSDIHTLFDKYLMGINPDDFKVFFAESAMRGKYKKLNGKPLRSPIEESLKPSQDLLRERWHEFCVRTGRTL